MRLLFVNGHLKVGGVEKSLIDLLKSIDYTKHDVDLLLFEGYGDYLEQVPSKVNIILCDLHSTYGSFVEIIKKAMLKREFKTIYMKTILTLSSRLGVRWVSLFKLLRITPGNYDCAIAYRVGMSADYVAYSVNAKKKFVWWHHGEFDYDRQIVERWCATLKKVDKLICVSEATKKMVMPHLKKKPEDIEVIPNMININEVREKSELFNPYEEDECNTILISVGRMSPEKCMINTVLALDILVGKGYENLKWYLVGDGVEHENIKNEIRNRNLQDYMICVGEQLNPYPFIKYADIFVHPSYVESQGITVLEAFALEKPCVITKSRGTEEFVVDGKNALLVEQSVEDLVEKIMIMIDRKKDELYDGQFQKETVNSFSSEQIIKKVMALLEE